MQSVSRLFALAAVAALSASALADDRVLIIPLNNLNVPADKQWISKAAQENLIADLGRTPGLDPIAFNGQVIVEDNATAARIARDAKAPYVIRGSAQVVGENVRLTAQLIDSASGDTLRTALVTGNASDLLKLEDDLANQIRGTAVAATPVSAPAAPQYIPVPGAPQVIVISQPDTYYPSYSPAYYPPYYSTCFPAYYSPFGTLCYDGYGNYHFSYVTVTPPANHGHDGDHDHDNHGGGPGVPIVRHTFTPGDGGGSLPIPTSAGNILPIPTPAGNILPNPTSHLQPIPVNNVQPIRNTVPVVSHVSAPPAPSAGPPSPRGDRGPGRGPR